MPELYHNFVELRYLNAILSGFNRYVCSSDFVRHAVSLTLDITLSCRLKARNAPDPGCVSTGEVLIVTLENGNLTVFDFRWQSIRLWETETMDG